MTCTEARERFLDLQYGLLDPTETALVEAHARECPACDAERAALLERWRALDAWQPEGPKAGLAERAIGKALEAPALWLRRFRRSATWAAAACVLAGTTLLGAGAWVDARNPDPQETILIGDTQLYSGSEACVRVVVRDQSSGVPLPGKDLLVELLSGDRERTTPTRLGTFATDARGTADVRFTLPDLPPGEYSLRVQAAGDPVEVPVRLRRGFACLLSTDKPLYQPAQTIHARVLALRLPARSPAAGEEARFSVTDPKGNVIYKETVATSRFGIAAMTMELADEVNLGHYRVRVAVGDTESERAVEVKRYVLPKYKVSVHPGQGFVRPGARLVARVDATYSFGKPVSGAALLLDATAEGDDKPFASAQAVLDGDGAATLELPVPAVLAGTSRDGGDAGVLLTARVTDGAGHTEQGWADVVVSPSTLRALVVPCQTRPVTGIENEYFVIATHPDGTPAEADVRLSFGTGPAPAASARTGESGVARLRAIPPPGAHAVVADLRDDRGETAQARCELDPRSDDSPFLFWTDRAVHRVGETLHAHALKPGASDTLFLDVIQERRTVLTRVVDLREGRADLDLDLTEDLAGALELHAYRLLPSGEFAREVRFVQVLSDGALRIELTLDRPTYRPGEEATLSFHVTDRDGRPTPAALGLAAVDEALFALVGERPGLDGTRAAIEERLLAPLYQIKYPWSPALFRAERGDAAAAGLAVASRSLSAGSSGARSGFDDLARKIRGQMRDPAVAEVRTDPRFRATLALLDDLEGGRTVANSWRVKVDRLDQEKRNFRRRAGNWWSGLGMLAAGIFFVWLLGEAAAGRQLAGCFLAFVVVGVLAALLLPTLSSARKSSLVGSLQAQLRDLTLGSGAASARDGGPAGAESGTRVRQNFPELLYWNPEILTDDQGQARVTIPLADSITTWRLTQSAVSADGRIGSAADGLPVFQDFFVDLDLPVSLTQGDEVSIPVAIYNYLDAPQTVELRLEAGDALELLDGAERSLTLSARQVAGASFRARAVRFGTAPLTVWAKGSAGLTDAVRRSVPITPDGTERTTARGGWLRGAEEVEIELPDDAIAGTEDLFLRVYPSRFSEVMHGLESIVQLPYG